MKKPAKMMPPKAGKAKMRFGAPAEKPAGKGKMPMFLMKAKKGK